MGCGGSKEAVAAQEPQAAPPPKKILTSEEAVEALLKYLKGTEFSAYVESFVEKECVIFDDEEEDFEGYYKVHKAYKQMVDDLIIGQMHELGIADEEFIKVLSTLNGPDTTYIVNTLLSTDDFQLFKSLMIKRNVELTRQVLDIVEQSRANRPPTAQRPPTAIPAAATEEEPSGVKFNEEPEVITLQDQEPDPNEPAPVLVAIVTKDQDEMTDEEVFIQSVPQETVVLAETFRGKTAELEAKLAVARDQYEEALAAAQARADAIIREYQERFQREFEQRRQLHNQIMELKGNIRVLCRIRPMIAIESGSQAVVAQDVETVVVTTDKGTFPYTFNRVFPMDTTQEQVFQEVVGLVVSCLDGFNVCVLAYGQTGSGKTYTMEGPPEDPGVNTRLMSHLFGLAAEKADAFSFDFKCSVVEIYNEHIFDMLVPGKRAENDALDCKEGDSGIYLPGLTIEDVNNMDQLSAVLNSAKGNRTTAATSMNERSSRSHLVTSVYVTATNIETGDVLKGKLHLIDLAGSERLSRTGAEGDRLKEAQAINSSLSALGDVIQALQQHQAHIPYRNSKLTRLLQDSLGGQSKCVLMVNCSPAAVNAGETKNALEFAARAQKVELGAAKKHVNHKKK